MTTGSGLPMPEELLTVDRALRDDLVADLRAGEPPAHEPRLLLEAPV